MACSQTTDHMEGTTGTSSTTNTTAVSTTPPYKKSNMKAQVPPFPTLLGEYPLLLAKTVDGNAMITNFRLCVCERRSFINLPIMMIAEAAVMETTRRLKLSCKDGSTYVCMFATSEDSRICMEMLRDKIAIPSSLQDIFAFIFHKAALDKAKSGARLTQAEMEQTALCQTDCSRNSFDQEVIRLGFDTNKHRIWKMSHANETFEFCPTYPKLHVLPASVDDEKLKECTDFRAGKRFPSVVWRDSKTGVVLIRSSQPLPSFLGLTYFSNEADVFLLEEIVKACIRERDILSKQANSIQAPRSAMSQDNKSGQEEVVAGRQAGSQGGCSARQNNDLSSPSHGGVHRNSTQGLSSSSSSSSSSTTSSSSVGGGHSSSPKLGRGILGCDVTSGASPCENTAKPMLAIVDCRSRAMIWGNSFKGGGTEDEAKYKCSIIHLDLPNIHSVRDSFNKLRSVCHSYVDGSYYKSLCGSMWLSYISALLRGANIVVELMFVEKRPVLVHCSDGWDRTAQIVSLAELLMDPYYRTIKGFQVLVEREWLQFGHKFGERGGHDPNSADINQQSPVFLQFLDCVYQLTLQYPANFQFNEAYLFKLLKHSQACLFGTFLHNSEKERQNCPYKSASLWSLLKEDNSQFVNLLYSSSSQVMTAHYGEHDIVLWKSVYMAGLSPIPHRSLPDFCLDQGEEDEEVRGSNPGPDGGVSRSRSVDDLSKISTDSSRRSSDPNIAQSPDPTGSAVSPANNSAATHDTSSSSAEIIHYPDESSPSDSGGFHSCESNMAAVLDGGFHSCESNKAVVIPAASKDDDTSVVAAEAVNGNDCHGNDEASHGNDEASHGNDSLPSSAALQNDIEVVGPCSLGSCAVDLECTNIPVDAISPSSSNGVVKQADGSASLMTSTDEATTGRETITYAVLSSSEQQNGISSSNEAHPASSDDPNNVVLDNCNGYCTLNSNTCHPKIINSSSSSSSSCSSSHSNGKVACPSTKARGSNSDGRTISLLSERLAEDEDKKHKVVNGGTSSPDSENAEHQPSLSLKSSSSSSSPCSQGQHSSQSSEPSRDIALNSDERKLFDLKKIAQQQFRMASRNLTSSQSANAVAATTQTNGSSANHSSLSTTVNADPKAQQQQPIPITTRKANGYTLNGHCSTHEIHLDNNGDEVSQHSSASVADNTVSTDTLVGDLDDALRESPRVPCDQVLGIETGNVGYFSNSLTSTLSTKKDACCSVGGQDSKRNLTVNKMVKTHPTASGPAIAANIPQGANKGISRRARTASGASRDLSVSPSYSTGNWSDTGRLRHPSSGESSAMLSARRCIAASVSTSTTDISDSCVGKIPPTTAEKQTGNVRQHLDVDSLTLFSDHRQDLLTDLVSEKDRKISELECRLSRAIDFIRASRNRQFQQQQQACPVADEFLQNESEGGEHSSLGTVSNPASDTSWEQLDETEEKVVLWVPDDVVTHCAGCDKQFWFYRRKHHCRNCGKIFCFECRNYLAPMPNVYMKEPQRVCRRCHSRLMQLSPGASCDGRIPTLVADG